MCLISLSNSVIVTIGMCVKNCAKTVEAAVKSVLLQDFPRNSIELIIVDGYSSDKTLNIIKRNLKNFDIKTRIFRENKGLGYARQIVVDNSKGKYIVWVDGDMVLSKDFVGKQVSFMEQHPDAGIAKGKYCLYTDEKRSLAAYLENIEFVLNTALEGEVNSKILGASGCIYRVEAIRQIGGFDKYISGVGEDMDIEKRVQNAGWKLYISRATFYEIRRNTWKSLWDEYFWHGKGNRILFKKNSRLFDLNKMFPPITLLKIFARIPPAYKLTRQKIVLFIPFHYIYKRIAWFFGFLLAQ